MQYQYCLNERLSFVADKGYTVNFNLKYLLILKNASLKSTLAAL